MKHQNTVPAFFWGVSYRYLFNFKKSGTLKRIFDNNLDTASGTVFNLGNIPNFPYDFNFKVGKYMEV